MKKTISQRQILLQEILEDFPLLPFVLETSSVIGPRISPSSLLVSVSLLSCPVSLDSFELVEFFVEEDSTLLVFIWSWSPTVELSLGSPVVFSISLSVVLSGSVENTGEVRTVTHGINGGVHSPIQPSEPVQSAGIVKFLWIIVSFSITIRDRNKIKST